MINSVARLQRKRENGESGFTLIELLVVVVIIGILVAIAVPLYLNYRKGANDKAAQSDLRGAIASLEQCNADLAAYPTAVTTSGNAACSADSATLRASSGTSFAYFKSGANYSITSTNSGGTTNRHYCYSSEAGGSIKAVAAAGTAYVAACP